MNAAARQTEQLLTAREVAERLGVEPDWVLNQPDLARYYLNRPGCKPVRFRWSDVEAWLTTRRRGPSVGVVRDLRPVG